MSEENSTYNKYEVKWGNGLVEYIEARRVSVPPDRSAFMMFSDESSKAIKFFGDNDELLLYVQPQQILSIRNMDHIPRHETDLKPSGTTQVDLEELANKLAEDLDEDSSD